MVLKVIVSGAQGKMGSITCSTLENADDLQLVGHCNKNDNIDTMIKDLKPDIVVDFTTPSAVYDNCKIIIANKVHPLIGTTGLSNHQIDELKTHCNEQKLGAIIAPNFSLGAILMMKYAKDAASYFPDREIIEMHHDQKIDAPSGTAFKTAELMAENCNQNDTNGQTDPSRGKSHHGIPIHSIRLPGLFAHQSIMFGNLGETLTIRHDALNRAAMMPGVLLACRKLPKLDHLVYGLEGII
ncbi:MAG: 4-hydroxy-tetrahydrodipicolinate reductase [Gammaproteobacteria bacterium]|nr:4-hydroxy-tetrahydrodipicolinate reductase [Gammaproteobacteria bacterium]MCH9744604.1 4-hydroxy-tetrahydrodipicolinate reductase [Gammaproteobacteria bacterium]